MAGRTLAAWVAVVASLTAVSPAWAVGEFASGSWKGSAYFTGPRFTHCAMSAGYDAGWRLVLTMQNNGDVVLGISHQSLNFKTGSTIMVQVQVDNTPVVDHEFLTVTPQLITATLTPVTEWFQRLRKGVQLKVRFGQTAKTFNLKGTNEALVGLSSCAAKFRSA
jgi:hypothetical protein